MTNIQIENWKLSRPRTPKGQVCVSIQTELIQKFHTKYPKGNFSMFVEQKLKEELGK